MSDPMPPSYPRHPAGAGDAPPPLPYDVGEALSTGFRLFGRYAAAFVPMMLVIVVTAVIFTALSIVTAEPVDSDGSGGILLTGSLSPTSLVFNLLASVASTLLGAALVRGALDAVDGRPVSFAAMFERWDKVQVLIAALVVSILTLAGTMLLVIPGLVVAFLLWYTNFFIVDRGLPGFEAIKESFRFTGAHVGPLLLTALLAVVINLAGACLCVVGLLVTAPATMIMAAVAFRQLQGRAVFDGR